MKLLDAVSGASTPEALALVFEEIGRRYLVARGEEKKFSLVKGEIRDVCVAALRRLETDTYEWSSGEKRLRAKVYPINKVKPTQALADLLCARGLAHLVKHEVVIDDTGLFREVRRGTVGIEEVRELSEIGRSEGFRISEITARNEDASQRSENDKGTEEEAP